MEGERPLPVSTRSHRPLSALRRWRRPLALLLVLILAAAGAWWWSRHDAAQAPSPGAGAGRFDRDNRPVPVKTALVVLKDVPIWLDAVGTVQAYNTVTVRPRVDGELVEVLFREGQDVKAGMVLARIDSRTYRAQHDQAQATRDKDSAQLQAARTDLARYESLGNRVTGQSVDTQRALVKQLEATVRADQAAVSNAATMLDYTTITAPIDGRTGIRAVDVGNIVRASDTTGLVTLTQIEPISVLFTLPQQVLPAVNRELAAQGTLTVTAVEPDTRRPIDTGRLELVDNQIDQTTGTIRMKAVMPNPHRLLWPGGFVNVRLLLTTRHDGLVIPAAAVQRGPKGPYAFVVKPDQTVEMRPVTVGTTGGDEALIDTGLEAGETVVVEGMARLKDGARIATAEQTGPAPAGGPPGGGGEGKRERRRPQAAP